MKVKYGDIVEITNQQYQNCLDIGQQIKVKRIIPSFNAVEYIDEHKISIWILPEDYKIIRS